MSKKGSFGKFLLGLGLGVGAGMLLAPKKGEELRKDLKNKLNELLNKAKEIEIDDVRLQLEAKVDEIKYGMCKLDVFVVL